MRSGWYPWFDEEALDGAGTGFGVSQALVHASPAGREKLCFWPLNEARDGQITKGWRRGGDSNPRPRSPRVTA